MEGQRQHMWWSRSPRSGSATPRSWGGDASPLLGRRSPSVRANSSGQPPTPITALDAETVNDERGEIAQDGDSGSRGMAGGGSSRRAATLGTLQLIGITFFAVAGGPYGFEDSVGGAGALLVMVGLLLTPLVWSAPLALMTAELATMIPKSGGQVRWTERAFGPFWSSLNSGLAFFNSIFDNALYPVLIVDYLQPLVFHSSVSTASEGTILMWSWATKLAVTGVVVGLNVAGVDIVGSASIIFGLAVMAPFAVMVGLSLPTLSLHTVVAQPIPSNIDWGRFLTVLLWNTSGYDAVGNCAGQVADPGRSYPSALAASVALVTLTYALPTLVGASVLPDSAAWSDGTWVEVARIMGGTQFASWMAVSGAVSSFAILLTLLCTSSQLTLGMAQAKQLPSVLQRVHPEYGTPWAAILLNATLSLSLTSLNFAKLAEVDMLFYGLSTVLKLGALVRLRVCEPDTHRPFRIPLSTVPLAVATCVPMAVCFVMVGSCSPFTIAIGSAGVAIITAAYFIREVYQGRLLSRGADGGRELYLPVSASDSLDGQGGPRTASPSLVEMMTLEIPPFEKDDEYSGSASPSVTPELFGASSGENLRDLENLDSLEDPEDLENPTYPDEARQLRDGRRQGDKIGEVIGSNEDFVVPFGRELSEGRSPTGLSRIQSVGEVLAGGGGRG